MSLTQTTALLTTPRLQVKPLSPSMARAIHLNSLDDETKRFIPDEVFETEAIAKGIINHLVGFYELKNGPLVYAICLHEGTVVGYVQAVPIKNAWEIGYQIAKPFRGQGYAQEAVQVFVPWIMQQLEIYELEGYCLVENIGSINVLKKCGFEYLGCFNQIYQGKEAPVEKFIYHQTLPK